MTKKYIAQLVNKHSLKPIVIIILLIVAGQVFNAIFFEGAPISPILIAMLSVGACLHIFQKVLIELFAKEGFSEKNE